MQVFVNTQGGRFFADVVAGDDPCVLLWPPVVHTVLHALLIYMYMLYCEWCVCVFVCVWGREGDDDLMLLQLIVNPRPTLAWPMPIVWSWVKLDKRTPTQLGVTLVCTSTPLKPIASCRCLSLCMACLLCWGPCGTASSEGIHWCNLYQPSFVCCENRKFVRRLGSLQSFAILFRNFQLLKWNVYTRRLGNI